MPQRVFVCVLLLLLVFTSCKSYRYHGRRHHIVKKEYKPEILYIPNHILCLGLYRESLSIWDIGYYPENEENLNIHFNTDSIFRSFRFALDGLNIYTEISNFNTNYCDDTFLKRSKIKFKEYKTDDILEIIGDTQGKTVLFPAIFLENYYRNEASGSIIGGEGEQYIKQSILRILILIVRNNEIIYQRAARYFGDSYYSYFENSPVDLLEQESWDKLVELVMRDYVKHIDESESRIDNLIKEEPTKDYWQKY